MPDWVDLDPESGPLDCPVCGGRSNELGQLGPTYWLRCEACGLEFNRCPFSQLDTNWRF